MHELERVVTKSTLHYLADGEVEDGHQRRRCWAKHPGAIFNMGADPRLPPMPEKPTLIDYFKLPLRLSMRTCCRAPRMR